MAKRKFKKELLCDVLDGYAEGAEKISDEIIDQGRWSTHHWLVFRLEEKIWGVSYSHGSTEQQDESPFEYDDDEIECSQLKAVEKTVVEYVPVD